MQRPIEIVSAIAGLLESEGNYFEILNKIAQRLKASMKCNIVSIYRNDKEGYQLIANEGFGKEHIGKLSINKGRGLVHHIAKTGKTLCLREATSHYSFYYVHGLGEEKFRGFIGTPIKKKNRVLGILILQFLRKYDSTIEDIALMETVGQQVSGLVESSFKKTDEIKNNEDRSKVQCRGMVPGYFSGKVIKRLLMDDSIGAPTKSGKGFKEEESRLKEAFKVSHEFYENMQKHSDTREMKDILRTHSMMLSDPKFTECTQKHLKNNSSAEESVVLAVQEISEIFNNISDPYIQQRSRDVVDIGRRLFHSLTPSSENNIELEGDEKAVCIASRLPPSVLIEEGPKYFGAIIFVEENLYSHNIILAKSMGIPAVIISRDQLMTIFESKELFVDGELGLIVQNPTENWKDEYTKSHHSLVEEDVKDFGPCITQNGKLIELGINGGFIKDVMHMPSWITEVGLYRTEFQFFNSTLLPTEAELTETYEKLLSITAPKPVVLRILDTGADKQPPCMHFVSEENPVLGNRSIRYLLRNSEIFFTQLRAMLKAQAKTKGNLKILIPMVTIYEEVSRIRDHIQKVIRDLKFEGIVLKRPPLGVMIEVPAAINLIPKFSSVVDFFCIGTNDLLQYFFAADRTNSHVQYLCRWHNPAFLGTLKGILNSSKELKKSISVCGEMSGELWGGLVLVGLGYTKLSMDKTLTYRHHELFSAVNTTQLKRLCKKLIQCNTSLEVLELLQLFLDEWPSISEDLKELLQSELNNLINPS